MNQEQIRQILRGEDPTPFHAIDNKLVKALCDIIRGQNEEKQIEVKRAKDMLW